MSPPNSRRAFLKGLLLTGGLLALSATGLSCARPQQISGQLLGPSAVKGHRLRDGFTFPDPSSVIEIETAIVGGGIAGLSAAWWLQKQGYSNFKLFEMESHLGGNAYYGENNISQYPWAAHYIPIPNVEAKLVKILFEELGVITGYDSHHRPLFNELYLCHEPEERLFRYGRWTEGIVPHDGISLDEQKEFKRFFQIVKELRQEIGKDGKPVFAIPIAHSSQDQEWLNLDKISMMDWLVKNGFATNALHWYITYCCRDDYGATPDIVSAWAGLHYFAGRRGVAANAESHTQVTWPAGNGWIVQQLQHRLDQMCQSGAMAYKLELSTDHVTIYFCDTQEETTFKVHARQAILACPRFIADRLLGNRPHSELNYSPWMVANVSLRKPPNGQGAELAWDNVSYHSRSLGYVVATHQNISSYPQKTVLTHYWPLTDLPPKESRQAAYGRSYDDWCAMIIDDLKKMHPDIEPDIEAIDVWLWGHGMIIPSVGYLWDKPRQSMQSSLGRVHFAHSDMSGLSLFEEAQYHGVEAARRVLEAL